MQRSKFYHIAYFFQACLVMVFCVAGFTFAAAPTPYRTEKAAKQHTQEIAGKKQEYRIPMGGTLDGFNTANYYPTYAGCMRQESKFEPNEYVLIENIGEVNVQSPRIVINGRRNWFTAEDILAGILKPEMNDAEKAMAIYMFLASHEVQTHENDRRPGPPFPDLTSHPSRGTFKERGDPVRSVNNYYCGGCSLAASNYAILARRAGLIARSIWLSTLDKYGAHSVAEVWYDGAWHLFDPDQRVFFLEEDNTTIASYESLHKNPMLAKRTVDCGFASAKESGYWDKYAKWYPPHVMPIDDWAVPVDMTLRPGESFLWRWDHIGKYRQGNNVRKLAGKEIPYQLANGKMIYRPRLATPDYQHSAISVITMNSIGDSEKTARLQSEVPGIAGCAMFKVVTPYPVVGAMFGVRFYRKTAADSCKVFLSVLDSDWTLVAEAGQTGETHQYVSLDEIMDCKMAPPIYEYFLKFEVTPTENVADAWVRDLYFETDVQMSAMAIPALSVGENRVVYTDQSVSARRVRITHGWKESSETAPPLPPQKPVFPAEGQRIALDRPARFVWEAAQDPDNAPLSDYHIQVSPREDMLHPVSPNLDLIIGSGTPGWDLPAGWLVQGRSYYWRVRARDDWGAWSDWSRPWKFTVE